MTAAIYTRASTGEQTNSVDQQVRECTARAKQLGLTVGEVYKDDGISGSRHDRPGYRRMLEDANGKAFDTLLLWKQSRLGRDSLEVERAIRQLEFHGVRIVTIDGYDTASGSLKTRKLTRGLNGLIDENYSETLREDTVRGLGDQYAKGYWCGGRVFGYKLVEVTSPTEKDAYGRAKRVGSRLEIDAQQAKLVREIFDRFAKGASPQSIAADLNAREVPSPGSVWKRKVRRCKGWARSAIWQMLRNPLYSGSYYWNRSQWTKTSTGRVVRLRKIEERMGHVGNAPELRIIQEATWKLVQIRLSANNGRKKDKRLQSGGRAVHMLSGVLRCGHCDAHFVLDSATHYRCGSVVDGKACTNEIRVRRDVAERVILRPVIDKLLAPEMVDEMVEEMRRYYTEKLSEAKAERAARPAAVAELDKRIARLQERLKTGDPDMAADELMAVIEKAEGKRTELLSAQPEAKRTEKLLRALPAAAKQYRDQITKGLQGNRTEAGRARIAVRRLLVEERVVLKPAKGARHLMAHFAFRRAALLGTPMVMAMAAGSVGSGGSIA